MARCQVQDTALASPLRGERFLCSAVNLTKVSYWFKIPSAAIHFWSYSAEFPLLGCNYCFTLPIGQRSPPLHPPHEIELFPAQLSAMHKLQSIYILNFSCSDVSNHILLWSGMSNELFYYDRNNLLWTDLTTITTITQGVLIPRAYFGFAGAGEKLYLHAGFSNAGITLIHD